MDWNTIGKRSLQLPTIGAIIFILFTTIAMLFYSGGSQFYPTESGYSFFNNFFSDLGTRTSYSQKSNLISSILFTIALTAMGISIIPFFIAFYFIFQKKKFIQIIVGLGSSLGLISAISYVGIGFTPWDIYLTTHMWFVYIAFPLTLPAILLFSTAIFLDDKIANVMAVVYLTLALILIGYIYLLFWGPETSTDVGRKIQVVGQKIIVYAEVVTFFIQGIVIPKNLNNSNNTH